MPRASAAAAEPPWTFAIRERIHNHLTHGNQYDTLYSDNANTS